MGRNSKGGGGGGGEEEEMRGWLFPHDPLHKMVSKTALRGARQQQRNGMLVFTVNS